MSMTTFDGAVNDPLNCAVPELSKVQRDIPPCRERVAYEKLAPRTEVHARASPRCDTESEVKTRRVRTRYG